MKPIALLLVCLLIGSAAGYGIAYRDASLPNHFGPITDPDQSWKSIPISDDAPQAVVEGGTVFVFGRMELNSVGKHTFIVRNEGQGVLELTMEGTTCKCTMADLKEGDKLEVAPGESTEIKLEWRPKSYQEDFAQTARIATNDPRNSLLELRITGSVVQAVVLDPAEVRFTNLAAGETRKAATKALSYKESAFEIKDLSVTGEQSDLVSVTQRPLTEEELKQANGALAGYLLEVEVKPGLPLGTNRHTIVAHTTSEFAPELEIPVTSFIVGDISVIAVKKYDRDKSLLYLNKLKKSEGAATKLFLIIKGPHRDSVSVKLDETFPKYMKVEVGEPESLNNGTVRKIPLTVEIPAGVPEGNFLGPERKDLGKIALSVEGHPEIKEVNIGVYFSVE
ncbi:hypothetical protein C5Y96_19350 [Blastopirellula marina]|uniref:DUF1573 domain-containing protein n=1 Tax=Blastopirellula marina TaxID=124 RepID=A0A2S8F492_9BACT|nr:MULTISPECIES: DUF1573 domain-containing protein [Pirellulaceae]PQO26937.1 hypothetical protein C5Y96_19350 [Blastopirellula marina]RCS46526.1 DUF1573 domain-containing protein [Bremerella cremea]